MTSIVPLSVQWDAADLQAGNRIAVVIIDQTGSLNATQHGSGTVTDPANNILVLSGNAADLTAELSSITLNQPDAGFDTIDIETYGTTGRLSDNQVSVLAAAPGQSVDAVNATSTLQGWVSSSSFLNTGTVIASGSVLTSETLQWSTTGTLASTATLGQSAFVKIDSIHEPLAEYGVENAPGALLGTATSAVADIYDPSTDDGAFPANGYANDPGVNNVSFAPLAGWIPGSFNPDTELTPLIVVSTIDTFDPVTGDLEASVDSLAPDPLTVVDLTGTHSDTFAAAFNDGGSQVTEFNTGNNPAWQAGWGNQFSTATLTYDSAGQLVEAFMQGGPSDPLFTIDDVFDPNTGQLWEEFQSTIQPPVSQGTTNYATTSNPDQAGFDTGPLYVTEFNTGDNPNWDYVDWGSTISSDTEIWTDDFIMENFTGFVENFPGQYSGALNAYSYEFIDGTAFDLMNMPGAINVNLNALGTIVIDSQTMASALGNLGLNTIDAAGATGTVTIVGLTTGDSTLIGGDDVSTVTGYGDDTIIAGSGVTTINTGSGGSTIGLSGMAGSQVIITSGSVNDVVNDDVAGDTVAVESNDSATVNGSGGEILVQGTSIALTTLNETVTGQDSTTFTVNLNGTSDNVLLGTDSDFGIVGSSGNVAFISGMQDSLTIQATPGAQVVGGFNLANGDQLDLRQILAGVGLTPDLSNLGSYVSASSDGSSTVLTITGPDASDTVLLSGINGLSLQNLIDGNGFMLPSH